MNTNTLQKLLEFSEKTFTEGEYIEIAKELKKIFENIIEEKWKEFKEPLYISFQDESDDIYITHIKFLDCIKNSIFRFNVCNMTTECKYDQLETYILIQLKMSNVKLINCNLCEQTYCLDSFMNTLRVSNIELRTEKILDSIDSMNKFYTHFTQDILPDLLFLSNMS